MPVETLTEFPRSFAAGDTLRVDLSDADYPASAWALRVYLRGASLKSFAADSVGDNYELVIPASETTKIIPGSYAVTFVYTATVGGERVSVPQNSVQVLTDPAQAGEKSIARQTLEAMQQAFLQVSRNPRLSVNFAGQSFTNRNLNEFQDAIDRQQQIVDEEEAAEDLGTGDKRSTGIHIRFARECS